MLQVKTIQEEVDYYLKEYQEPDFFGNEYLYDDVVDPDILNTELSFSKLLKLSSPNTIPPIEPQYHPSY